MHAGCLVAWLPVACCLLPVASEQNCHMLRQANEYDYELHADPFRDSIAPRLRERKVGVLTPR